MNEKRRTGRYLSAFITLAIMLVVLFVWNVNSGSVNLSVSEILDIVLKHQGSETAVNIIWEIRLPRISAVIILGGALSVSGFLLPDLFCKPDCQPLCSGNILRSQAGGITCDDLFSEQKYCAEFGGNDRGCFCRVTDLYGICAYHFKKGNEYVHAGGQRCDDRLYLFRSHRFCGYVCR